MIPQLPKRSLDSHKGDFGRALLIGGSRGMSGAVSLAGRAALRSGAGLVTLATADVCLETVASFEPSYMTVPLACDDAGRIAALAKERIAELAGVATCVACGPGLGQSSDLTSLVGWLYRSLELPMVLDADALNALAQRPQGLAGAGGPRVLTPHPGEFRRLLGSGDADDDLVQRAIELAGEFNVVIVLKGHRTLTTDGDRQTRNETGNPGMATGGSGDVLTGVITALICQGLTPYDAARLGVHMHGLAGDLAAAELGQVSLISSDLIQYLPRAFEQFSNGGE